MRTRPRASPAGPSGWDHMGSSAPASRHALRPLAIAVAFATVLAGFLAASPTARAAFDRLEVEPGQYTGTNVYVPTETMEFRVYGDPSDTYDVEVFHFVFPFGVRTSRASFDDQVIPSGGVRTISWTVQPSEEDSTWYWVAVYPDDYFENGGMGVRFPFSAYRFTIQGYTFSVWTDRASYLPGDTVTVSWAALQIKDGRPAPPGVGDIQVWDDSGTPLRAPYSFNASTGSFSLTLATSADPDLDANARGWFNDTATNPDRLGTDGHSFDIDYLGVILSVDAAYPPGAVVTVDVRAKITDFPGAPFGFEPGAADVVVNITILDANTGSTTSYGATNLVTPADGRVSHVFQLAATPTQGTYDVQASATAHAVLNAAESDTFDVVSTPRFSVLLILDRANYVSGETVRATASADPSGANDTYQWVLTDTGGNILLASAGSATTASWAIPTDYTGTLTWRVTVNDGAGNVASDVVSVQIAFGYLALSVNPTEYVAGDLLTASYSLRSQVISNPTYFYEVRADGVDLVASGGALTTSFTYRTPDPAAGTYLIEVTASEGGRTVVGQILASQVARIVLSISTDRNTYLPGETIRISYALSARGPIALPQSFALVAQLFGSATTSVATASPTGEFSLTVPTTTNEGDLILAVVEIFTGAQALETVHIGSTNPLWSSEIAGIPVFAVLLALLVFLLLVGFIVLWRRTSMGVGPKPSVLKPAPPPPPAGPERKAPTTPMSVACKNCSKTIDLTTSKRPIEVMCPSCGETQLVT